MRHRQLRGALIVLAACLLAVGATAQAPNSPFLTSFTGNTGQEGNMFDIKSLTGIILDSFDVNVSTNTTIEVWALNMPGTYFGNHTSNANWTMLASVPVTASGLGVPTPLGLNLGFPVGPNQIQGLYITTIGGTIWYNVGTAQGALYASNPDIEFYEGHSGTYFNMTITPRVWNGNIHYSPLTTTTDDAALDAILSPANDSLDCSPLSNAEAVTIEIKNTGLNTIPTGTFLNLSYQLDNSPPVLEFFSLTNPLQSFATVTYTFATTVDLSTPGNYTLTASVVYGADLDPSNDTLAEPIGSGGQLRVTSYPFSEDFALSGSPGDTTPPLGFINETGDASGPNSDWIMTNLPTATFGTGPAADHTTGVSGMGGYAFVEDQNGYSTVNLRSPCFDMSGLLNPSLRFYMHSESPNSSGVDNTLAVDVISYPGGTVTMDHVAPLGPTGTNTWELVASDLSAFAGQLIQVVLRADSLSGGGIQHDIAIDDLSVSELLATPGQAPQLGLAEFDMNDALNPNGDPVNFGFGGPYYTAVTPGDTLVFQMGGESLMPVILFTGALNPVNASYSGIGSIDLGGGVDPVTGLPTGLSILADGTTVGGFNSFFVISAAGKTDVGFSVPSLPTGVLGGFQCAMLTTAGSGVALSNAIQLSVQ